MEMNNDKKSMKTLRALLISVGLLCAVTAPARAELWQGASTHPKGRMSLGFYGEVYGQTYALPLAAMAFGQFTYGHSDQLQIEMRLGFGMIDFYAGFFGKYKLIEEDRFRLAFHGGIHRQANFYLDGSLVASYGFNDVEFYLAPTLQVPLFNTPGFGLTPGMDFTLTKHGRMYIEGAINLGGYYNAASAGYRYFF